MPAYARKPAPEQARGARGRAGRRRSLPPGRLCRPHGHSRTAARAPAAADGHAGLVEALRAELMVRFTIDARPIRAEGATEASTEAGTGSGEGVVRAGPRPRSTPPSAAPSPSTPAARSSPALTPARRSGTSHRIDDCRSIGLPAPRSLANGPERRVRCCTYGPVDELRSGGS